MSLDADVAEIVEGLDDELWEQKCLMYIWTLYKNIVASKTLTIPSSSVLPASSLVELLKKLDRI